MNEKKPIIEWWEDDDWVVLGEHNEALIAFNEDKSNECLQFICDNNIIPCEVTDGKTAKDLMVDCDVSLSKSNTIDELAVRIVELKEELKQITTRRKEALSIIEEQRIEIRKLKAEIIEYEKYYYVKEKQ